MKKKWKITLSLEAYSDYNVAEDVRIEVGHTLRKMPRIGDWEITEVAVKKLKDDKEAE